MHLARTSALLFHASCHLPPTGGSAVLSMMRHGRGRAVHRNRCGQPPSHKGILKMDERANIYIVSTIRQHLYIAYT